MLVLIVQQIAALVQLFVGMGTVLGLRLVLIVLLIAALVHLSAGIAWWR